MGRKECSAFRIVIAAMLVVVVVVVSPVVLGDGEVVVDETGA